MERLTYDSIFDAIADKGTAADLQFRADMVLLLRDLFEERGWGQAAIVEALGMKQPHVSDLLRGKIDKFSSDKLITLLSKMGYRMQPRFVKATHGRELHVKCAVSREEAYA